MHYYSYESSKTDVPGTSRMAFTPVTDAFQKLKSTTLKTASISEISEMDFSSLGIDLFSFQLGYFCSISEAYKTFIL